MGTALIVLACPAFAQDANNPPQVSSPAEQAETSQLNTEQQSGNPRTDPQAQQQYEQQQEQYRENNADYQQKRAGYERARGAYERDLERYDLAQYAFADYPHPYPYRYEDGRLVRLYLIAEPARQLTGAPVEGPSGEWIGRVRNVDIAVDGRPLQLQIALNRRVWVEVDPGEFRFDPDGHVLYTRLTRADFWNLPGHLYQYAER
jgi:hypothetical protein